MSVIQYSYHCWLNCAVAIWFSPQDMRELIYGKMQRISFGKAAPPPLPPHPPPWKGNILTDNIFVQIMHCRKKASPKRQVKKSNAFYSNLNFNMMRLWNLKITYQLLRICIFFALLQLAFFFPRTQYTEKENSALQTVFFRLMYRVMLDGSSIVSLDCSYWLNTMNVFRYNTLHQHIYNKMIP